MIKILFRLACNTLIYYVFCVFFMSVRSSFTFVCLIQAVNCQYFFCLFTSSPSSRTSWVRVRAQERELVPAWAPTNSSHRQSLHYYCRPVPASSRWQEVPLVDWDQQGQQRGQRERLKGQLVR